MRKAREVLFVRSVFACGSRTIASRASGCYHGMERVYMSRRCRELILQRGATHGDRLLLAALSLLASHNSTFKKEEPNGGRCVRTRSSTR